MPKPKAPFNKKFNYTYENLLMGQRLYNLSSNKKNIIVSKLDNTLKQYKSDCNEFNNKTLNGKGEYTICFEYPKTYDYYSFTHTNIENAIAHANLLKNKEFVNKGCTINKINIYGNDVDKRGKKYKICEEQALEYFINNDNNNKLSLWSWSNVIDNKQDIQMINNIKTPKNIIKNMGKNSWDLHKSSSNIIIKQDPNHIKIESIDDMLNILENHPLNGNINNIRVQDIHNIKEPLLKLKNMIGMKKLKSMVFDQLIYFFQDLHKSKGSVRNNDYMHTIIYGPPGTGKTEFAKIIGELFCKLKILPKNKFKKATRTDFIGGYLGQTAIKTTKLITECLGGVLFIDEAYALGNKEGKDSYAKECIDTLCEALSDKKDQLMVIIAGYEEDLDKCFFSYNSGLKSRFPWKYVTDNYNYEDLYSIFIKMVKDISWKLHNDVNAIWFEDKIDYFTYFGRDIETFLSKVKIAHSRRVFCLTNEHKRIINVNDLNNGYDIFLENK